MSRIVFELKPNNDIEIIDTDFGEEYIEVQDNGDNKIITVSVVPHQEEQDIE